MLLVCFFIIIQSMLKIMFYYPLMVLAPGLDCLNYCTLSQNRCRLTAFIINFHFMVFDRPGDVHFGFITEPVFKPIESGLL